MIDRSDPTIETRRETSHILPADDAASKGWFYDPQLRPMPYHFARYREAIEAGIVEWLRVKAGEALASPRRVKGITIPEMMSAMAQAIEAGEHRGTCG